MTGMHSWQPRELGAGSECSGWEQIQKSRSARSTIFIKKHMDVIVIIARDCKALSEAVERAHNARDQGDLL